jgi:hypothetical protein
VIGGFYKEKSEEMKLDWANCKLLYWFRYVFDAFVFWSSRPDNHKCFLNLLNSVHTDVQFTMENLPSWTLIMTGNLIVVG